MNRCHKQPAITCDDNDVVGGDQPVKCHSLINDPGGDTNDDVVGGDKPVKRHILKRSRW